ncbi:hypothetical protein BJ742DRAFT_845678 [Cladochytrium replicatum]|nr:hypothetical protein BJ742DRAFT_845678 [Cladochytrium replicatum]
MDVVGDPDLSRAIRALSDTLAAKLAQKDAEISRLRSDIAARDSALHDARVRIESLESNLARADRSLADMSCAVERLTKFRSAVLDAEEDEVVTGYNGAGLGQQRTTTGVFGPVQGSAVQNERQERQVLKNQQQQQQMDKMDKISVPPALVVTPSDFEDSRALMVSGVSPTFPLNHDAYIPDKTLRFYAPQSQSRPTVETNPQPSLTAANVRWTQQHVQQQPNTGSSSMASLPPSREPLRKHHQQAEQPQQNTKTSGNVGPNQNASSSSSTPVDGREFFKRARGLLSYDEFTTLLWNVRAYNAREQSRQKTLENLEALMGEKHRGLFVQFENMVMGR